MNAIADVQVSVPPVAANAGDVIGVDLAKNVFQLCIADSAWRVLETRRLTRRQFESFFLGREVALVVMEACGSAHHWARWLNRLGIEVLLLPPAYVRAYVRRNRTDAADAAALLQAARDSDIKPVRVKSVEQQALQGLHRTRSLSKANRTQRIIMAPRVTPTPIDADNLSGSTMPAAPIDWRFGDADSMSARAIHSEPTTDAGYSTAGSTQSVDQSINLLRWRGSPYEYEGLAGESI